MNLVEGVGAPQRQPALDGLRGLAVAGVVAFHLGYLRGGFLGVDAFFVLSGYLITGLLVTEWRTQGSISLRHFWARRARRLLPALLLVMAAVVAYAWLAAAPAELDKIRGDGLATLSYVANWHALGGASSYFDQFQTPSPLAHAWSLAIEEQFYLLWPIVFVAVTRIGRRNRRPADVDRRLTLLLGCCILGAAASAITMMRLYQPDRGPNRVYLGTDTRVAAILIGAALSVTMARFGRPSGVGARRTIHAVAVVAGVGVGLAWIGADGTDQWLYRGGFAALGIGVAALIASTAVGGGGPVTWLLARRPLVDLGRVSYGLYLWHWPVIVFLSPVRTGLDGPALAGLRLAVSMGLTLLSYRLVEQPVRLGTAPIRAVRAASVMAPVAVVAALIVATTYVARPATAFDVEAAALTRDPDRLIVAKDPFTTTTIPSTRSVLVVGDSGAYYLGAGMQFAQSSFNNAVFNRGAIGCGIERGDRRFRTEQGTVETDPSGCGGYLDRWRVYLAVTKPDVVLLTVVATGGESRMVDGRWVTDCEPDHDAWLQRQAVEAFQVLGSTGGTVAVTTIPYGLSPVVTHFHQTETDCRNRVLRAAAAAVPATRVIDLASWVCPTVDECRKTVDGVVLRPDLVHFAGPGAVVAGRWVLGQLNDL